MQINMKCIKSGLGLRIKQTKLCSYLNGLEFKIWCILQFLNYMQCHLVMLNFHWLSQCQLALDQEKEVRGNKRQVKFLNHLCKLLVKLLKLSNYKKFNPSLFQGSNLTIYPLLPWYYILLRQLILANQENRKNLKLSKDYIA